MKPRKPLLEIAAKKLGGRQEHLQYWPGRFGRSARRATLVLTLACAVAIRLPAGTSAAGLDLPKTIRLVRGGSVGDRYQMQFNTHTIFVQSFEKDGQNDDNNIDTVETKAETRRVRTVNADGSLTVEERPGESTSTIIKNGDRDIITAQPDGWLSTYKPNGQRVTHTKLPQKATPATGADDATEPQPPAAKPDSDDRLNNEPSFPDKALHVGDTWTGTTMMLPKEISSDPTVNYTAKLVAIELHRNVPCARVDYTLSAISIKLPTLISKQLAFEATGKGTINMTGTVTEYYTLDRGAVLDSAGKSTITMKFDLTEPDPNGQDDLHRTVQVSIKTTGAGTATQFPTYAPALVPDASSAGK